MASFPLFLLCGAHEAAAYCQHILITVNNIDNKWCELFTMMVHGFLCFPAHLIPKGTLFRLGIRDATYFATPRLSLHVTLAVLYAIEYDS